jgi:hypothetical protein
LTGFFFKDETREFPAQFLLHLLCESRSVWGQIPSLSWRNSFLISPCDIMGVGFLSLVCLIISERPSDGSIRTDRFKIRTSRPS